MNGGPWIPGVEDACEDPYDAQDEPGASWAAVDLADTLRGLQDGSVARLAPSVGDIGDSHHLFYRGKVNGVAGDSNGGKSWLALAVCTQAIATATVVYVDLEDDQLGTVERLVDLGADPEAILNRFPGGDLEPVRLHPSIRALRPAGRSPSDAGDRRPRSRAGRHRLHRRSTCPQWLQPECRRGCSRMVPPATCPDRPPRSSRGCAGPRHQGGRPGPRVVAYRLSA